VLLLIFEMLLAKGYPCLLLTQGPAASVAGFFIFYGKENI
jgi:hypothetical protein